MDRIFHLGIAIIEPFIHLMVASWPRFSFLPGFMPWLRVERQLSPYFDRGIVLMIASCGFSSAEISIASASAVFFHTAVVPLPTITWLALPLFSFAFPAIAGLYGTICL